MSKLRVGIAGFMQESNSLAPRPAVQSDFEIQSGSAMVDFHAGTNSEIAGFLEGCEEHGWEPVPLVSANAISGGVLARDCFERISAQILEAVNGARIHGLLLTLHGAMSTEDHRSADAEFARRVRETLGPTLPFSVSHDFHANVQPGLLRAVDGLAGYRTYPHVDQRDTGRRAAAILGRVFDGAATTRYRIPVPMLVSPHWSSTFERPLKDVMALVADTQYGEAGIYCVQPWLDFTPMSSSVVWTDWSSDPETPERVRAVAQQLWDIRREFRADWTKPEDLIAKVRGQRNRPVLVSEAHDGPTGGAAGDHTGLLSLLLPVSGEFRACLYLVDPEFAARARETGEGGIVEAAIGAKIDSRFSHPLPIRARVERLTAGAFVGKGPAFTGRHFSMGPTAVVSVGGIRIVAASLPVMMIDPELFRSQGIEPAEQDMVGIKSPTLFRPAYDSISRTILYLDMPGPCQGRLEAVAFKDINRPIYPLDDFEWQAPEAERYGPL